MTAKGVRFSVIGLGRVGSSLGPALEEKGWRCVSVYSESSAGESRRIRRELPGAVILSSMESLQPDFDLLFITTPDDQIGPTAEKIASLPDFDWRKKVVLHASGVIGLDTLASLKDAGAHTGAFHPISAFAKRYSPSSASHIYYDFLGEKTAKGMARKIAALLNARLLILKSDDERQALHLASVIVSNFTVIGMQASEGLISRFIPRSEAKGLLLGLLGSTSGNLARVGSGSALTGPLARGDIGVIMAHLKSLENYPSLSQFYRSSSLLGVELLLRSEMDVQKKRRLLKIKRMLEA